MTVRGAYAKRVTAAKDNAENADSASSDFWGPGAVDEEKDGDELLEMIEETWTGLHNTVTEILARRAAFADGGRAIAAPAEDIVVGEVIERRGGTTAGTVIVDAEVIDGPGLPSARPDDDQASRIADLRKERRDADGAVVAERISEETYRRIVARIDAELRELRESS